MPLLILWKNTPFCSARRFVKLSYNIKNVAYAAGVRTTRKRNMAAGVHFFKSKMAAGGMMWRYVQKT